jgi:transposase
LRDLTRSRTTCVRERAPLVNRVHQARAGATRKLASVATDILGGSGRAILAALLAGETDPAVLAEWATGPLRKQRPQLEQALRGHLRPHQRFVLTELLGQIASLDESIARFTAPMEMTCAQDADEAEVVALLDGIPGLAPATAQGVVAEIGTAMGRFPSAAALAAWAGLAPGNDESAGPQRSGRTRTGNVWRRTIFVCAPSSFRPRKRPRTPTTLRSPPAVGTSKRWWRSPRRCS